jgi:hypothetical protein
LQSATICRSWVWQSPYFVRADDGRWIPTTATKQNSETMREQAWRTGVGTTFYDALENVVNTSHAIGEAIVNPPARMRRRRPGKHGGRIVERG